MNLKAARHQTATCIYREKITHIEEWENRERAEKKETAEVMKPRDAVQLNR